jgi:hypothetical protein
MDGGIKWKEISMKITHLVMKIKDVEEACTPHGFATLQAMNHLIYLHRLSTGRNPEPQYIVINRDEPYIEEIIAVMKRHGQWSEEAANEKIVISAINKAGVVYTGRRHHNIIAENPTVVFKGKDSVQGFVTNYGRFLNREDALQLALTNGQYFRREPTGVLTSEDLW